MTTKKVKKKKRKEKKSYTYYQIKEGKLIRRLKKCPRCTSFMAIHKGENARYTCGKCAYTEYQTTSEIK
ncbi:30S ribosomal protein S27ae [Candidatus Bathyarchaeota archaeon]|nr:MAG: 30S ribosomal protein S27ae [Candidatus Bathyarchaeota archaeon]